MIDFTNEELMIIADEMSMTKEQLTKLAVSNTDVDDEEALKARLVIVDSILTKLK